MQRFIEQKPVHTFTKLWSLDLVLSVKVLTEMTLLSWFGASVVCFSGQSGPNHSDYGAFLSMVTDPTSFARRERSYIAFSYLQRDTDTRKG